jgi:hypothetical protein
MNLLNDALEHVREENFVGCILEVIHVNRGHALRELRYAQ